MLKPLDLLEWTPDGGFGCMCVELPASERLGCKADDDTKASQGSGVHCRANWSRFSGEVGGGESICWTYRNFDWPGMRARVKWPWPIL